MDGEIDADAEDGITSDYEDSDSAGLSEFTSVRTTHNLHAYEHGRRYQGLRRGRYGLPNDDGEQLREGVKHELCVRYILNGALFLAPIGDNPQKIVDLGTGQGLWAQEVAEQFPSAQVIGADLSAIQPVWTPPNVEFRIEDLEDEDRPWTKIYEDADLIHIRAMLQTLRNPQRLIERSFDNVKSGGWIEVNETLPFFHTEDGLVMFDHPFNAFYRIVKRAFTIAYGWSFEILDYVPELLRDAGFVNLQERRTVLPQGRWHQDKRMREMGMLNQGICEAWVGAVLAKHETIGMTTEEAKQMWERIEDALNDPNVHACNIWMSWWAQKPTQQQQ